MKQFLTVVAVGVLGAFILVACGDKPQPAAPTGGEAAPAASTGEPAAPAESASATP